jgi:hypothetical protein
VKVSLPFNLLPVFEGTGIADCFRLKNRQPENHTLVELAPQEVEYFLAVLGGLEQEMRYRYSRSMARGSHAPVSSKRRSMFQERADLLIQAKVMVERASKKS